MHEFGVKSIIWKIKISHIFALIANSKYKYCNFNFPIDRAMSKY